MKEKRGHWYLLTGLIIGALIGLAIVILLVPVNYIDTEPYALKPADRDLYRKVIAKAYLVEADNARAFARLALLQDVSAPDALVAQAQRELGAGGSEADSRALALLAEIMREGNIRITPLPVLVVTDTPTALPTATLEATPEQAQPTPTFTITPGVTITLTPTATAQPTLGIVYELADQQEVCEVGMAGREIQVFVLDRSGKGIAGVRIEVSVPSGGAEAFFTGLQPDVDPGYADYLMTEGMTYNLRVGETGQLIQNLSIPRCKDENNQAFAGSIRLEFRVK